MTIFYFLAVLIIWLPIQLWFLWPKNSKLVLTILSGFTGWMLEEGRGREDKLNTMLYFNCWLRKTYKISPIWLGIFTKGGLEKKLRQAWDNPRKIDHFDLEAKAPDLELLAHIASLVEMITFIYFGGILVYISIILLNSLS